MNQKLQKRKIIFKIENRKKGIKKTKLEIGEKW